MKWFAIKGPDGQILNYTNSSHRKDCWAALGIARGPMSKECFKAAAHRLGYRCVKVQLVEKDAVCEWAEDGGRVLKTSCGRYWQTLEDGDRIDFPYCPYCGRKIVDSTAPTGGAESKEEGK